MMTTNIKRLYGPFGMNTVPPTSWKGRKFFMSRTLDKWVIKLHEDAFLRTNGLPHLLEKWWDTEL